MNRIVTVAGAVLMVMGVVIAGEQETQPADKEAVAQTVKKQTVCPVMGGQISTNVYADANGKRIYFCCKGCPAEFKKNPAKYIINLAGVALDTTPATDKAKEQPQEHDHKCGGCCE